jgi:predicted Zn-dependent protease
MNKRLSMLEKLTQSGSPDPFAWYGLALEYKKEGRTEDAFSAFSTLRARHPDYLPMYLMAGELYVESGRLEEARDWLSAGIELARARSDHKTLSELETALSVAK